jgi:hypothetical protein
MHWLGGGPPERACIAVLELDGDGGLGGDHAARSTWDCSRLSSVSSTGPAPRPDWPPVPARLRFRGGDVGGAETGQLSLLRHLTGMRAQQCRTQPGMCPRRTSRSTLSRMENMIPSAMRPPRIVCCIMLKVRGSPHCQAHPAAVVVRTRQLSGAAGARWLRAGRIGHSWPGPKTQSVAVCWAA